MKTILFIVSTEYHLFSALSVFYKTFNNSNYRVKLIAIYPPNNAPARLKREYDLPFDFYAMDDHLSYFPGFFQQKEFPDYRAILEDCGWIDEVYTYFDSTFLITLIVNHVKNRFNSKVFLMHEGTYGYVDVDRSYLARCYFKSLLVYSFLKYCKHYNDIDFVYTLGRYKKIDEFKTLFPDKIIKKLILHNTTLLDISIDTTTVNLIKKIFHFEVEFDKSRQYILCLPFPDSVRPFWVANEELPIIKTIADYIIDKPYQLLVKPKSTTDASKFRALLGDKALVIDDVVPAEVLVHSMYNSIIISPYSATALCSANNNIHFWTFPLVKVYPKFSTSFENTCIIRSIDELLKRIDDKIVK